MLHVYVCVDSRDILVMTAQLLVNALKSEEINIMQFTLLVFDECHHTNLNHAFNQIMHAYLKLKLDELHGDVIRNLPQVSTLTLQSSLCNHYQIRYELRTS